MKNPFEKIVFTIGLVLGLVIGFSVRGVHDAHVGTCIAGDVMMRNGSWYYCPETGADWRIKP